VVGNLDEIGERLPQQHRAALEAALRGAEVTRALLAVARLSNVLLNLLINSGYAMRGAPGEHRITLRTRRVSIALDADEALAPGGYALNHAIRPSA